MQTKKATNNEKTTPESVTLTPFAVTVSKFQKKATINSGLLSTLKGRFNAGDD
jgi:hypothetical protein